MAFLASLIFGPTVALAGTSTEFDTIHQKFRDWVQGTGGMAASLAAIGIGGLWSIMKGPIPILGGIGSAIFLQYSPDISDAIFTATV
jgi:conjugal transfer pilus assembly protein TraA